MAEPKMNKKKQNEKKKDKYEESQNYKHNVPDWY